MPSCGSLHYIIYLGYFLCLTSYFNYMIISIESFSQPLISTNYNYTSHRYTLSLKSLELDIIYYLFILAEEKTSLHFLSRVFAFTL